jgi:hypothetical protein
MFCVYQTQFVLVVSTVCIKYNLLSLFGWFHYVLCVADTIRCFCSFRNKTNFLMRSYSNMGVLCLFHCLVHNYVCFISEKLSKKYFLFLFICSFSQVLLLCCSVVVARCVFVVVVYSQSLSLSVSAVAGQGRVPPAPERQRLARELLQRGPRGGVQRRGGRGLCRPPQSQERR